MDTSSLPDVIEQLKNRCEKIGLYMRHHAFTVAGDLGEEGEEGDSEAARIIGNEDELKAKLAAGDIHMVLFAMFTAKDLAFSERIQNPEGFAVDTEFQNMMPSKSQETKDKMAEKMAELAKRRAAGEEIDILDLLDDDE